MTWSHGGRFSNDEQASGFGRFPDEVSQEDLQRFCWLDDTDLSIVGRRRGMHNRLGFAVLLATVRIVGRFLTDPLPVPWPVVESLAGQLGIADASILKRYAQRDRPAMSMPRRSLLFMDTRTSQIQRRTSS